MRILTKVNWEAVGQQVVLAVVAKVSFEPLAVFPLEHRQKGRHSKSPFHARGEGEFGDEFVWDWLA